MKIKRWIVTAVDFDADGQCDGKARVLAACNTKDEALDFITEDMREYVDNNSNEDIQLILNDQMMRVSNLLGNSGCEWNLEEVEIEVDIEKEVLDLCNDAYDRGYSDCQDSIFD